MHDKTIVFYKLIFVCLLTLSDNVTLLLLNSLTLDHIILHLVLLLSGGADCLKHRSALSLGVVVVDTVWHPGCPALLHWLIDRLVHQ